MFGTLMSLLGGVVVGGIACCFLIHSMMWPDIKALKRANKPCRHRKTTLRVLKAAVGCETTAVYCHNCNRYITEPKTEC